jgi:hypothetical protein
LISTNERGDRVDVPELGFAARVVETAGRGGTELHRVVVALEREGAQNRRRVARLIDLDVDHRVARVA